MARIKNKRTIIFLILIAIAVLLYLFAYSFYGYSVAEKYAYAVKESLVSDVTNLPPYYKLNNRFQNEISEELYDAKTIDEFLVLFERINAVDCEPNLFQKLSVNSTDKGKKEACEKIESSDGTIYFVYHHIDIASTLFFEPVIVDWTIDIEEIESPLYEQAS